MKQIAGIILVTLAAPTAAQEQDPLTLIGASATANAGRQQTMTEEERQRLIARAERQRRFFLEARSEAERGSIDAQHLTGLLLWNGQGTVANAAAAVGWWRTAAQAGHAEAASTLGFVYEQGLGIPQNDAESRHWHRVAAVHGNGWSACQTARMLASTEFEKPHAGSGQSASMTPLLQQDSAEAYFWYIIGTSRMQHRRQPADPRRASCMDERNELRRDLGPEVVAAVQARAATWKPGKEYR